MKKTTWIQIVDVLLLIFQAIVLVRLFTVHPSGEKGFDGALRVAGQTLLGLLISVVALLFAALTRKTLKMQRWFAFVGLFTTAAWCLLFLLASVAV